MGLGEPSAPAPGDVITSPPSHSSNYGGIDPENEDNLAILDGVPLDGLRNGAARGRSMFELVAEHYYPAADATASTGSPPPDSCPVMSLPAELIDSILCYLSPVDLTSVARTCRKLYSHATAEIHWLPRVQANVPGVTLTSPYPCQTYHELYGAHDAHWFLPKHRIWFSNRELMGKLVIVRYDQRRGCIEGYQLVAVSNRTTFQHWPADNHVIIHAFDPKVKLHLDKPVVQLRVKPRASSETSARRRKEGSRFAREISMRPEDRPDALFSNFMYAKALDADTVTENLASPFPYGDMWPPPAIPARHRVSAALTMPAAECPPASDRPTKRSEVSDQAFRIRQWMEMGAPSTLPAIFRNRRHPVAGMVQMLTGGMLNHGVDESENGSLGPLGIHIGEEVDTYSTLDPKLYTPTELKPWRGIWVGDYSGHGCEFLLINQPDEPDLADVTDAELGLERALDESEEDWQRRRRDARIYRGRLEAVKLTGDPNVPRGEYTFVAEDLGEKGFVGVQQEAPFKGARMVKSKGHIAGTGFHNDKYIESQLLLISHDRLAQYWVGFGHISFFERVNIDQFLDPLTGPSWSSTTKSKR